jgi:hypothetical protein
MATTAKHASKAKNAPMSTNKVRLTAPSKIKEGDVTRVAEKTNFSPSYVSNVKAGRRYNATIVAAFNSLTARRK